MGKQTTVNTRTWARASSLVIASVFSVGLVGCEQPLPKCDVTQSLETGGNFAAKYTLKTGSATGTGDCDTLPGDVLYFGSFYKRNGDDAPNYRQVSIGIQPESTLGPLANAEGAMVMPNPDDKPYAYGQFDAAEPGAGDFCVVSELSPARVRLPVAPAWEGPDPEDETGEAPPITNPEQPDIDLTYDFSKVQVYMTAGSPGRQITAELTYSRRSEAEGVDCSAKYTVAALFPATPCASNLDCQKDMSDEDCQKDPMGMHKGCPNNPIFPDDAVECDPDLQLCVPAKAVPSFR